MRVTVAVTQCFNVAYWQWLNLSRFTKSPPWKIMFSAFFCRNSSAFQLTEPQSAWNVRLGGHI